MNYEQYIELSKNDPSFCPVTHYSLLVNSLSIKTGKSVQMACKRHLKDLEHSFDNCYNYEYEFSRERANHIYKFVETFCKHSKGEWSGKSVQLELWQKFIFGSLMGWIRKDDKRRRFTLSYTQIARKNGKSLLSSALSLYMFMIDKEPGSECYCASVKRDTAKIVWLDSMRMIKSSPLLRKDVKIQESFSTMWYGNNVMKALSADSGQDGLNIHCFSLDEYHLAKDNKMYEVLVSGMGSRRNPLGFIITTAGESRGGTSPCYEFYEYCKQILKGVVDNENLFIYIAEMDSEEEMHDPSNWIKSNPNLNVSVKLESLEQAYKRAMDGNEKDNFLIKNMNMWIQRKDAYFPLDRWSDKPLPQLEGNECYLGIDMSSKIDLTSVSAVFPLENGEYAVENMCFMPEDSITAKEKQDKVPYRRWVKEGYIILTPGDVVDIEYIFKYIQSLSEKYKVLNIGVDPWNATALMTKLDNEGYTVLEVRQGYKSLSESIKFTKELIIQGKLIHGNNPVLKWCTANAVPQFDTNENVVLNKAKSINRIDAIAATITAMTQARLHDYNNTLDKHIDENYSIW